MHIKKKINFAHGQSKMKNEGDIILARDNFFKKNNKNLFHLLKNRFEWMNDFINENDIILELGSGTCISKKFITNNNHKTSDLTDFDFLDYKNINAMDTGFNDEKFSKIISSNMIHHIPYPLKHLKEILRILKPGGFYIIQEVNCSIFCQIIIILMRHEGFDFTFNPLNENSPSSEINDLWASNNAVPNLIFDNFNEVNKKLNYKFEIIHNSYGECLTFINSGGVISKTFYLPMNDFFNRILKKIDNILVKFPKIFALQRSIVLKKL